MDLSVGLVRVRIHGSVTCHRTYTWICHLSQDVYMVQSVGLVTGHDLSQDVYMVQSVGHVTGRIHGSVSRTCHRTYTWFSQ